MIFLKSTLRDLFAKSDVGKGALTAGYLSQISKTSEKFLETVVDHLNYSCIFWFDKKIM